MSTIEDLAADIAAHLPVVEDITEPDHSAAPNLPSSFWQTRPRLTLIRTAAHARMVSADAVFGAVLARVALAVPPTVVLPAPVSTPGTLDLIVTLIGDSGAGKSASADIAAELLPIEADDITEVPLGSGEGLIESYLDYASEEGEDGKKHRVKRQVMRGVLATLDEGQALAELGGRKGSTLMETIRSAWSGKRLGQANATEERKRHLEAGSYRFAMIAGFQLEHATALIGDAAGGTPQRFLFFNAIDPEIPASSPEWPGKLIWRQTYIPGAMSLDGNATAEIRARKFARTTGTETIHELDAHRDLLRLKVAGLLAILEGRRDITCEDWTLAGIVLDTSDQVRQTIIDADKSRRNIAERASIASADRRAAALDNGAGERAIAKMARAIGGHVQRGQCPTGCHRACVNRATASRDRKLAVLDDALDRAVIEGWIATQDDRLVPGEVAL